MNSLLYGNTIKVYSTQNEGKRIAAERFIITLNKR